MEDSAPGERQRLFVAVPLPAVLHLLVERAQSALPQIHGLRLLGAEQWHVTLAFIGEVDGAKAATACRVVEGVPGDMGGEALLGGFLMLPSAAKARVVTLELTDTHGVFAALYETVMSGLEAGEVMRREKRPFRPHLTIARLRTPTVVRPRYESETARFAVQSVCLYRSELRREGAVYTVVCRKGLEGGGAEERA
jgi:RNA 2',3'-cyclic 3'-phosphodiesterase